MNTLPSKNESNERGKSNKRYEPHGSDSQSPSHLDDFLRANSESIGNYVEKSRKEGIDYNKLLDDCTTLLFGDTDHRQHALLGGLETELSSLRYAKIHHIALEMPRTPAYTDALEKFYSTGDVSHVALMSENTRTPVRMTRLFKRAYDTEIRIHFIDMPKEDYNPTWSEDEVSMQRGVYMGKQLAALSKLYGRILAYVGYSHLEENQIPSVLASEGVRYTKVALVSAGQPSPLFSVVSYFEIGASEAIRFRGLQHETSTVYLDGAYGLNAFIHFPRVRLSTSQTAMEDFLLSGEQSITSHNQLLPLHETRLPAVNSEKNYQVEPYAEEWEDTNKEKVSEFIESMRGLSPGQKLYLSILLENYVRLSMHHGGGSIHRIEYDAEAQAFGIDTVDTFGYRFNPRADYGSLARHREVTLSTLLSAYGFSELDVKCINDLPKTDVKPNPAQPENIYKVLLLMSTYAHDPERIKIRNSSSYTPFIAILNKEKSSYLIKLSINDFALSPLETRLLNTVTSLESIYSFVPDGLFILSACEKHRYQNKGLHTLGGLISDSTGSLHLWGFGFRRKVLASRQKLQYLENSQALQYITKGEQHLRDTLQKLDTIKKLSQNYRQLQGKFNRKEEPERSYTFLEITEKTHAFLSNVSQELTRIKQEIDIHNNH